MHNAKLDVGLLKNVAKLRWNNNVLANFCGKKVRIERIISTSQYTFLESSMNQCKFFFNLWSCRFKWYMHLSLFVNVYICTYCLTVYCCTFNLKNEGYFTTNRVILLYELFGNFVTFDCLWSNDKYPTFKKKFIYC